MGSPDKSRPNREATGNEQTKITVLRRIRTNPEKYPVLITLDPTSRLGREILSSTDKAKKAK